MRTTTTKPIAKRTKTKTNGLQDDDNSKPAQLAKLIYPAIVRVIMAKRSQAVVQKPKFVLDSTHVRRINVDSG